MSDSTSLWQLQQQAAGEALDIPRSQFLETVEQCDLLLTRSGSIVAATDSKLSAFLLGISSRQPVDNFAWHWFMMRLDSFLYIDRMVVTSAQRRHGHATALLEEALGWCRREGIDMLVCQVHERPPNPVAHALCRSLGFQAIESVMLPSRDIVTMYQRSTASATP